MSHVVDDARRTNGRWFQTEGPQTTKLRDANAAVFISKETH